MNDSSNILFIFLNGIHGLFNSLFERKEYFEGFIDFLKENFSINFSIKFTKSKKINDKNTRG